MYCGYCGSETEAGSDFCPNCGKKVEQAAAGRRASGAYRRECTRKRRGRHIRKFITFLVILLALVAVGQVGYHWWENQMNPEVVVEVGGDSYTGLVKDYLAAAESSDLTAISALFFPGSEDYYQNADGTRTLSQILPQEDKWVTNYGKTVAEVTMENAQFANLSGDKAGEVVATILSYSGLQEINEMYSVQAKVTYTDGSAVNMVFEVLQCEEGCFLVTINGSAE